MQPSAAWEDIAVDVVGEAELLDGSGHYSVVAPFRAMDAATVPIGFRQEAGSPDVRRLILVIDENPAPVAAEFSFGQAMQPVEIEMRVRIDAYTNVRAIVETVDGDTYMTGGFVRAAGGCAAPSLKDAEAALAALGQMKLRWFDEGDPGARREAQVMLRHPNYTGFQVDPISLLHIPAHFIDTVEVAQGGELLFAVTGGISISEDPAFRFRYTDLGGPIEVRATDTDGGAFEASHPAGS
jgi:sulfur-oxidizing protein SoxY